MLIDWLTFIYKIGLGQCWGAVVRRLLGGVSVHCSKSRSMRCVGLGGGKASPWQPSNEYKRVSLTQPKVEIWKTLREAYTGLTGAREIRPSFWANARLFPSPPDRRRENKRIVNSRAAAGNAAVSVCFVPRRLAPIEYKNAGIEYTAEKITTIIDN